MGEQALKVLTSLGEQAPTSLGELSLAGSESERMMSLISITINNPGTSPICLLYRSRLFFCLLSLAPFLCPFSLATFLWPLQIP